MTGEEFFSKQIQRFSGGIYIYVKKKSKDVSQMEA